ncbi:MAG: LamG domain-containing protein [Candidatus Poribacteria bacterium]|nr:LamG domain-containing protein [Candidatus Poribacteria bacterium]
MNFSNCMVRFGLLLVVGMFVNLLSGWAVEADKDLILYYPLDKDTSDASGKKNSGELKDKVSFEKGKFGKAIKLIPDQPILIEPSDSLHGDIFLEPFSYTLWIKPDFKGTTWEHLWRSLPSAAGHNTLFVNKDQGLVSYRGRVGGWTTLCQTDGGLIKKDTWTNVTLTSDTKKFKIYIDGDLKKGTDYKKTDGKNTEYRIGGSGGETYAGLVDEVAFNARALSDAEIKSIARVGMEVFLAVDANGKLTRNWAKIKTEY